MALGAHERVSPWEEKWESGENLTPDFPTPRGKGSSMAFHGVTPYI